MKEFEKIFNYKGLEREIRKLLEVTSSCDCQIRNNLNRKCKSLSKLIGWWLKNEFFIF